MRRQARQFSIFFIIFAILGILALVFSPYQNENFWNNHGLFFLFFIAIFPRLTLFFSSVPFGGIFWWLGFFIAPRFLVAILATITYGNQNPILVVLSWIIAISGETGEKMIILKKAPNMPFRYNFQSREEKIQASETPSSPKDDIIDAEYREL